jgi:hypothetical protein
MNATAALMPDDRELTLARAHPRATEKRRLTQYRESLLSSAAYASLPRGSRDEIVRWAELRLRLRRDYGIDADAVNLVDPLVPEARLRALVIEGEVLASAVSADVPRLVADAWERGMPEIVTAIRGASASVCE